MLLFLSRLFDPAALAEAAFTEAALTEAALAEDPLTETRLSQRRVLFHKEAALTEAVSAVKHHVLLQHIFA